MYVCGVCFGVCPTWPQALVWPPGWQGPAPPSPTLVSTGPRARRSRPGRAEPSPAASWPWWSRYEIPAQRGRHQRGLYVRYTLVLMRSQGTFKLLREEGDTCYSVGVINTEPYTTFTVGSSSFMNTFLFRIHLNLHIGCISMCFCNCSVNRQGVLLLCGEAASIAQLKIPEFFRKAFGSWALLFFRNSIIC